MSVFFSIVVRAARGYAFTLTIYALLGHPLIRFAYYRAIRSCTRRASFDQPRACAHYVPQARTHSRILRIIAITRVRAWRIIDDIECYPQNSSAACTSGPPNVLFPCCRRIPQQQCNQICYQKEKSLLRTTEIIAVRPQLAPKEPRTFALSLISSLTVSVTAS